MPYTLISNGYNLFSDGSCNFTNIGGSPVLTDSQTITNTAYFNHTSGSGSAVTAFSTISDTTLLIIIIIIIIIISSSSINNSCSAHLSLRC